MAVVITLDKPQVGDPTWWHPSDYSSEGEFPDYGKITEVRGTVCAVRWESGTESVHKIEDLVWVPLDDQPGVYRVY